jgi:ubiquinone biosynthesis protein Coq4
MQKKKGLRNRLVARLIGASVPFLNRFRRPRPFPYTLEELRQLPSDTLGAQTASFLDQRHFDFLPMYETHDVIHTLLEYGTTTTGELRLQAFMVGNRSASFAGRILFLIGAPLLPEIWRQLKHDFLRGRRARQISRLDFTIALRQDVRQLREQLKI